MGNNLTEAGRRAAEIRAKKRAEALRANLKRRKEQSQAQRGIEIEDKGEQDANSQNSE